MGPILGMTLDHISLVVVDILSAKILYQEGGKEVAQWAMLELGANFGTLWFTVLSNTVRYYHTKILQIVEIYCY